jgi:hypothetical protein
MVDTQRGVNTAVDEDAAPIPEAEPVTTILRLIDPPSWLATDAGAAAFYPRNMRTSV